MKIRTNNLNMPMRRKEYLFWTILILLLATFMRVHRLQEVPFALSHDEAINALDALDLMREGNLKIFYLENNGREPLHIYVQAVTITLLGTSPWALLFASVAFSLVTIASVGLFALTTLQRIVGKDLAQRASLLSMFLMATLFWSVMFSRLALRAIFLLPFLVLTLHYFLKGVHSRRMRYFLLCGLILGVSTYTYLPARLIPVILICLVAFLATATFFYRKPRKQKRIYIVKGLLLTAITALLVFLPLGVYFWQHPDAFWLRTGQVILTEVGQSLDGSPFQLFVNNLAKNLRLFIDFGDHNSLYNVPNRPTLHPIMAAGFLVGILVLFRHWKQTDSQLILIWFVVMLLPSILSGSKPSSIRAIGVLPVVCIMIGIGWAIVWKWIIQIVSRYFSRPIVAIVKTGAILFLVVFTLMATYGAYFTEWPVRPVESVIRGWTETEVVGRFLSASPQKQFLISGELFHPTMRYHTHRIFSEIKQVAPDNLFNEEPISLFTRINECRVKRSAFWFDHLSTDMAQLSIIHPADMSRYGWQVNQDVSILRDKLGNEVAKMVPVRSFTSQEMKQLAYSISGANFANNVCLLTFKSTERTIQPGEVLHFQLDWEVLVNDYKTLIAEVVLVSPSLQPIGPEQRIPLDVSIPSGNLLKSEFAYPVPDNIPNGKYLFRISILEPSEEKVLAVYDDSNRIPIGDYAYSGNVTVTSQPQANLPLNEETNLLWQNESDTLSLTAYDVVVNDDLLEVTTAWEAISNTPYQNYTLFVHVLDSVGHLVSQSDGQLQGGQMPTNMWFLGEEVSDRRSLDISSLKGGEYQVTIGWYEWESGERLLLANGVEDAAQLVSFMR